MKHQPNNRAVLANPVLNRALVRTKEELKAGPHIRAVVNCHGQCWIEFKMVEGKPFLDHHPSSRQSPWKIYVKGAHDYVSKDNRYFVETLLGRDPKNYTRCFKFNNRVWLTLQALLVTPEYLDLLKNSNGWHDLLKNPKGWHNRPFCEILNGGPFTDEEWKSETQQWEFQKHSDAHFYKEMVAESMKASELKWVSPDNSSY